MKRLVGFAAVALTLCMFLTATAGDKGVPVTRPYWFHGHSTFVINLQTGEVTYSGIGEAAHVGRAENVASGYIDPNDVLHLVGTVTSASGENIFWTVDDVQGPNTLLVLTGGTGRFEGVTGELNSWQTENEVQLLEWPLLTITSDQTAWGWISY